MAPLEKQYSESTILWFGAVVLQERRRERGGYVTDTFAPLGTPELPGGASLAAVLWLLSTGSHNQLLYLPKELTLTPPPPLLAAWQGSGGVTVPGRVRPLPRRGSERAVAVF